MRTVLEFALGCLIALGFWLFLVVVFSFGG
jgi:hypothetical protein